MLKGMVNRRKPRRIKLKGAIAEAFRTLYVTFIRAPILIHYNVDALIKVKTDTLNFAYLGILS
jgi:hypothetical protein